MTAALGRPRTPPCRRLGGADAAAAVALALWSVPTLAAAPPWSGGHHAGQGTGRNQTLWLGTARHLPFTQVVTGSGATIETHRATIATLCGTATSFGPEAGRGVGGIVTWPLTGGPPPVGPPLPIAIRPNGTFSSVRRGLVHFAQVATIATRPVSGTAVFTMAGAFHGGTSVSGHVSLRLTFSNHTECPDASSGFGARR